MEAIAEKIKLLTSIHSPSGEEISLRDFLKKKLESYADKIEEDVLGNLYVYKYAKDPKNAKSLMLVAHLDEVAMMVSFVEDNGYLRVSNVGGVDVNIMKGRNVVIMHEGEEIFGVIGVHPYHMSKEMPKKDTEFSDLWVDIGATSRREAESMVAIGDYVLIVSGFHSLINNCICARACDDKVGVAVIWDVLEKLSVSCIDNNLVAVFSVQEEVGLRGAKVSSFTIKPDLCIAVDVVHASDYPNVDKHKYGQVSIGAGPIIPIGTNFTPSLQKKLMQYAMNFGIPFQRVVFPVSSGTDISAVQTSSVACITGLVAIPCRYMHSPVEVVSVGGVHNCAQLLFSILNNNNIM